LQLPSGPRRTHRAHPRDLAGTHGAPKPFGSVYYILGVTYNYIFLKKVTE